MDFEFGLLYSFRNPPRWRMDQKQLYDEMVQHIQAMEQVGMDVIWLTEHHFSEDGYLPSLAPMTAAIAMVTERVTIGHGIIELPLHHPVALAEDLAVADILSGGRVRCGVGLGRMNFDWRTSFENEGLVFGASNVGRDRARMFEEQIEILRLCWADEPFSYRGEFYEFPEIDVTPKPVREGGPEIWFGVGDQAKRPLDRAARMGNGWIGSIGGLDTYYGYVREHDRMAEAGRADVGSAKLPAKDPEAAEAKYGAYLRYVIEWYNPGGQLTTPGFGETAPRATSQFFDEPAAVAKQLDEARARGATGVHWFAPVTGLSPLDSIELYSTIITELKPLMAETVDFTGAAA
jgi:alkanesulfonate monooxygenase SsuD/methylene tetrahydromethanopterin reductase-like flavin-dependent oxidoreductase (luciferase family)